MPTYEYRCRSCGHEFEEFQSMSSDPLTMCPKCAKPSLKRLMSSGVGLVFKGSGFYLTDYKKSNSSAGSSNSKAETKPADKPSKKTEPAPSTDGSASTEKK